MLSFVVLVDIIVMSSAARLRSSQERVQPRTVERLIDVPVTQVVDEIVEQVVY